jgi:stress response protein YsnF
MTEEPVVSKSVRIAEEVAVRKEGTDTVRTVKDKVRRQQVEVDKNMADKNISNEVRKAA